MKFLILPRQSSQLFHEIGIECFHALRTDAVAELGFGVVADIDFHLVPVALVVADLLAARADGHDAAQGLDLIERLAQLLDLGGQRGLHLDHAPADLDAGAEFAGVEGLGQIVVGPGLEPGDDVGLFAPGGQHDDVGRPVGLQGADPAHHLRPVHLRHHPVENGQSGASGCRKTPARPRTVERGLNLMPSLFNKGPPVTGGGEIVVGD